MSLHTHHRAPAGEPRALGIAFGLTVFMMVIEAVAAWASGSLALLADAGHMLTDASMLGVSLFAAWVAARPATLEKTYGYYRTEILAALANGIGLWLLVVWIILRAIERLAHPSPVESWPMIAVAAAGLVVNIVSGAILKRQASANLNVRAAWLNVMADALGSIGVIVAGLLIHWRGVYAADPIASVLIALLIAVSSWNLVKQSVNILLEATPGHVQVSELVGAMRSVSGVHEVHDVHLWTITTGMDAMSCHVIVNDLSQGAAMLEGLNRLLAERFRITHTTFQLEPRDHVCDMQG